MITFLLMRDGEIFDSETVVQKTSFDITSVLGNCDTFEFTPERRTRHLSIPSGTVTVYPLNDDVVDAIDRLTNENLSSAELGYCYDLLSIITSECFNGMVVS